MAWIFGSVIAIAFAFVCFRRKSPPPAGRQPRARAPANTTSPFAAVVIKPGADACQAVAAVTGIRFLASDAPKLPVTGCDQHPCRCTYERFADRRSEEADRRLPGSSLSSQLYETTHGENRRTGKRGRRKTDH